MDIIVLSILQVQVSEVLQIYFVTALWKPIVRTACHGFPIYSPTFSPFFTLGYAFSYYAHRETANNFPRNNQNLQEEIFWRNNQQQSMQKKHKCLVLHLI